MFEKNVLQFFSFLFNLSHLLKLISKHNQTSVNSCKNILIFCRKKEIKSNYNQNILNCKITHEIIIKRKTAE